MLKRVAFFTRWYACQWDERGLDLDCPTLIGRTYHRFFKLISKLNGPMFKSDPCGPGPQDKLKHFSNFNYIAVGTV